MVANKNLYKPKTSTNSIMKGLYQHLRTLWKKPDPKMFRPKLIEWRKQEAIVKVKRPTRLDRARSLGYKAKQGIMIVRVRVPRGGHERPQIKKGRRSKNKRQRLVLGKNYQTIAEQRVNKKYHNFEVLNSYWVGQDGKHYFYEVIMVDPLHPVILSDKNLKWLCTGKHRGRVYRGLTSSGRKGRGLRNKGKGAEKIRPSLRANKRRGTN